MEKIELNKGKKMAKNTLYEILEVSENASPEVIEKAYKILVKKYHPDLQPPEEKKNAEDKMKQINEAYDILSNEQKRRAYDNELEAQREQVRREEELRRQSSQNTVYTQNNQSYTRPYNGNGNVNNQSTNNAGYNYDKDRMEYEQRLRQEEAQQRRKMQENLNKEYANAYNNYLRSLGYKVKESWTKEKTKDLLLVIAIFIVLIFLLWLFPPTRNWIINFYESNPIIKAFVNIVVSIVTGIFKGIGNFITSFFN